MNQAPVLQPHIAKANFFLRNLLWFMLLLSFGMAPWHQTWSAALLVGLPCALIPTVLILMWPQSLATHLTVASASMVFCALHIYQARGLTDIHFGIFVVLSMLLFYQDWRVILMGGAVIAVHHLLSNYLQHIGYADICFTEPGIGTTLLHAAYVVAEVAALSYLTRLLRQESASAIANQLNLQRNLELMRVTVERSQQGVHAISTAACDIATGNADLSARTELQATGVEKTVNTMETLMVTVRQNTDYSNEANQLVMSASSIAGSGGQMVTQVVNTMGSIRESSNRIVDIISVIDGIAFQTNILALNAAVEAARAGEQGRGFAVVASEVRNLAQRSATAAKEIKDLIKDSVDKIETGGRLVDATGQTMTQLVTSVQQVAAIMSEIKSASQEQSEGIAQVNQAISEMGVSTKQSAALVEQAAAASESLRDHAGQIASLLTSLVQSAHSEGSTTAQHEPTRDQAALPLGLGS